MYSIIFKGSIQVSDSDGNTEFLTTFQKDGYPTLVFASPNKVKEWLEGKIKNIEKHMDKKYIDGLMSAYGFSVQTEDAKNFRTRYQGETTFIDLWIGRKRRTIGIHNRNGTMSYKRVYDLESLENVIQSSLI